MSALEGRLAFSFNCSYKLFRLEVRWQDASSDPPWYGLNGLKRGVAGAVVEAVRDVGGIESPRADLSSSSCLRIWAAAPALRHSSDLEKRMEQAVLSVLEQIAALSL